MQLFSDTLRCPTCGAQQEWSDECRRCHCDLRLLQTIAQAYAVHYERCLMSLHEGRLHAALRDARECVQLKPSAMSQQLLAVCALECGDWSTAVSIGRALSLANDESA